MAKRKSIESPRRTKEDYFANISNKIEEKIKILYGKDISKKPYYHRKDSWEGVSERIDTMVLYGRYTLFDNEVLEREIEDLESFLDDEE